MIGAAIFPGRYVQGAGAFDRAADELARLGERPIVVCDPFVFDHLRESLAPGFGGAPFLRMEGEITQAQIERLAGRDEARDADVVVGLGGGRAVDAGKAVAHRLGARMASAPTVASSDAPCSSQAVIRTPDGDVDRHLHCGRNPDLVLVDTAVIAQAPRRFLAAGIGDALSTRFEAEASAASGATTMTGYRPLDIALVLARRCHDVLLADAVAALRAVEAQAVTPALERVVEAVILSSGLGFESGGLALPHALEKGLARLTVEGALHGERVAFATLVTLAVRGADEAEIARHRAFLREVCLPVSLADLGVEADRAALHAVAAAVSKPGTKIRNEPAEIPARDLLDAILATDAMARA